MSLDTNLHQTCARKIVTLIHWCCRCQLIAGFIADKRHKPTLFIVTHTICIYDLKTIPNLIVTFAYQEKIAYITNKHTLIACSNPIYTP